MNDSIRPLFQLRTIRRLLVIIGFLFFNHTSSAQKRTGKATVVSHVKGKRVIYGTASFYAAKFVGRKTASGELFSQHKYTAACNMLPLGTWIRVTNIRNNKSVLVKVNDRIHPRIRRLVDLSTVAAKKLGYTAKGTVRVKVEVLGRKRPPGA